MGNQLNRLREASRNRRRYEKKRKQLHVYVTKASTTSLFYRRHWGRNIVRWWPKPPTAYTFIELSIVVADCRFAPKVRRLGAALSSMTPRTTNMWGIMHPIDDRVSQNPQPRTFGRSAFLPCLAYYRWVRAVMPVAVCYDHHTAWTRLLASGTNGFV